jgi:hypothetical protein
MGGVMGQRIGQADRRVLGQLGVSPSITTSIESRNCGKAASKACSCWRHGTVGEMSAEVSVLMSKRVATTASAASVSSSANPKTRRGAPVASATSRATR